MAALKEGGGRQQHIFGIKLPATLLRQGKLSKSSYQEPGFQWHTALFLGAWWPTLLGICILGTRLLCVAALSLHTSPFLLLGRSNGEIYAGGAC